MKGGVSMLNEEGKIDTSEFMEARDRMKYAILQDVKNKIGDGSYVGMRLGRYLSTAGSALMALEGMENTLWRFNHQRGKV